MRDENSTLVWEYFEKAVSKDKCDSNAVDELLDSLRNAARDEGCGVAAYKLGVMYRDGKHVEASQEQSFFYFRLAADSGHQLARRCLWLTEAYSFTRNLVTSGDSFTSPPRPSTVHCL